MVEKNSQVVFLRKGETAAAIGGLERNREMSVRGGGERSNKNSAPVGSFWVRFD